MNKQTILDHYITAILWSSVDDDGEPLDDNYTREDFAPESIDKVQSDIDQFINEAGSLLDGISDDMIGHNLWFTRCGHGAGFWDRGLGGVGDQLTALCVSMPNIDPYIGDDGKVYL